MKSVLKPGAEFETLTQGELEESLKAFASGFAQPPRRWRDFVGFQLDANGNSFTPGLTPDSFPVYTVQAGMEFTLHRLEVSAFTSTGSQYTFGAPYTSSTGYAELRRSNRFISGISFVKGLPAVFSVGSGAPVYNNLERVEIFIVGGPPSGTIVIDYEGELYVQTPKLTTV